MRRRAKFKAAALLIMLCGSLFQGGCFSLTNDELVGLVNSSAQGFVNTLFNQWITPRIDWVFDVD